MAKAIALVLIFVWTSGIYAQEILSHYSDGYDADCYIGDEEIKMASWNVYQNKKGKKALYEQFENEKIGQAHIVLLQEAKEDFIKEVGKKFDYPYYYNKGSDAILSKCRMIDSGYIQVNNNTKRKAAWAVLKLKHKDSYDETLMLVYSIHLSYKEKTSPFISRIRRKEAKRVEKHSRPFREMYPNAPVVIAGDFNTISPIFPWLYREGSTTYLERKGFDDLVKKKTSTHFLGRLDWIFGIGFNKVNSYVSDWNNGSDHRWVMTKVTIDNWHKYTNKAWYPDLLK